MLVFQWFWAIGRFPGHGFGKMSEKRVTYVFVVSLISWSPGHGFSQILVHFGLFSQISTYFHHFHSFPMIFNGVHMFSQIFSYLHLLWPQRSKTCPEDKHYKGISNIFPPKFTNFKVFFIIFTNFTKFDKISYFFVILTFRRYPIINVCVYIYRR